MPKAGKSTQKRRTPPALKGDLSWKKIGRSYEEITKDDLRKLLKITNDDYNDFLKRHPKYRQLKKLAVCLCQGAALHYVDGKNGIRDFDTYIFFDKNSPIKYPPRRKGYKDFGVSKHGRTYFRPEHTKPKHEKTKGRSIDIMGRQIDVVEGDYKKSICKWLEEAKSDTPWCLAQKAVVVLEPEEDFAEVIWPKKKANTITTKVDKPDTC